MADIVNVDMANAWDGIEGVGWAENEATYERSTRRFWARFREHVALLCGLVAAETD